MCQSTIPLTSKAITSEVPSIGRGKASWNRPTSFFVFFAFIFFSVRILSSTILSSCYGFPTEAAEYIGMRVQSILHSSLLCPALIVAFSSAHKYGPSEHISKGTALFLDRADLIIHFCMGYMVSDSLSLCLTVFGFRGGSFGFNELLFSCHHFAILSYLVLVRVYKAGHMSAMMCMLLGELSNPAFNLNSIIGKVSTLECCCNNLRVLQIKSILQLVHPVMFLSLRVIIMPLTSTHMTYDFLFSKQAKENLPLAVRIYWCSLIWLVIFGGYHEIMYCKKLLMSSFQSEINDQEL